jgi:hypothetical protein
MGDEYFVANIIKAMPKMPIKPAPTQNHTLIACANIFYSNFTN